MLRLLVERPLSHSKITYTKSNTIVPINREKLSESHTGGNMSIYTPDKYTILEIKYPDELVYKVYGTWAGGYLGSDSWRLNSGIERAVINEGKISFIGYSGSEYQCCKAAEGVTGSYNIAELDAFLRREPDRVKVVTLQECIDNNYFEVEIL